MSTVAILIGLVNRSIRMSSQWVVVKFGGTSVANQTNWSNIAHIVQQHLQENIRVLVVCSAPSGVSNLLESLLLNEVSEEVLTGY